jgi:hypothetical protein
MLIITLLGFVGIFPGGDGIVARRSLPDGTQLLVTQTYGTADLGYEVGFYIKPPNADWGWCYLDHEGPEWRNGRIDYDEETGIATIWNGTTLRGRFTLATMKWEKPDVDKYVCAAPMALREPPFE